MVFKRLFSVAVVAFGMSLALPAHANIDIKKTGRNTDSASYRKNFGPGAKYRGSHQAINEQKFDKTIDRGGHMVGGKFMKIGSAADKEAKAKNGCKGGVKGPGATASAKFGTQGKEGTAKSRENGVKGAKFGCDVGVEATLVSVNGDCEKQLLGDENLGLDAAGGAEGAVGASAKCSCQGLTAAECEAFIGIKGGVDGTIGGQLCGLRLGIGVGVEGGLGAGGKVGIGKMKRGYGVAVAGYLGAGGGFHATIDPDLSGLTDSSKRAATLDCLKQKALSGLSWLGNLLGKIGEAQVQAAQNGGDAFMMP